MDVPFTTPENGQPGKKNFLLPTSNEARSIAHSSLVVSSVLSALYSSAAAASSDPIDESEVKGYKRKSRLTGIEHNVRPHKRSRSPPQPSASITVAAIAIDSSSSSSSASSSSSSSSSRSAAIAALKCRAAATPSYSYQSSASSAQVHSKKHTGEDTAEDEISRQRHIQELQERIIDTEDALERMQDRLSVLLMESARYQRRTLRRQPEKRPQEDDECSGLDISDIMESFYNNTQQSSSSSAAAASSSSTPPASRLVGIELVSSFTTGA